MNSYNVKNSKTLFHINIQTCSNHTSRQQFLRGPKILSPSRNNRTTLHTPTTPLSTKYTNVYKPYHETTIPARAQSPNPEPKQPNGTHKVLNLTPMTPDLGLAGVPL